MPYVPRAAMPTACAYCGVAFASRHLRRKYCCNSCNVLAARARQREADPAPPPLLAQLLARGLAVTPVAPPEPIGARTHERIHHLIPIQLHVVSQVVRLYDTRDPDAQWHVVTELWVGADGSYWVHQRGASREYLYRVNAVHTFAQLG